MRERAIRSPRTALILLLIRAQGSMSSIQLADHLGIPAREVHAYLAFLRRKGLITSNSYTFSLTRLGEEYVNKYNNHLKYVVRSHFRLNLAKLSLTRLNQAKQIVDSIVRLYDVGDCDDIVRFLVEFRLKTNRKYWWPGETSHIEELAEKLSISSSKVSSCLRKLEAQGVIFMTLDRRRGVVKIRLSRQLDHLFQA